MLSRRAFVSGLIAAGGAMPLTAEAQVPGGDVPRIGVLSFTPMTTRTRESFREGLREHGYVEGQNIVVEWRSAEGRADRVGALATELVRLGVRVLIAEFTPAVQAARNATRTIPIVMAPAGDPVAAGFVSSLARPGGNITGLTNIASELSEKRLELLREIVPRMGRVALVIHGADPLDRSFVQETQAAAAKAGLRLHVARVPSIDDLEPAFSLMASERVDAVIVMGNVPVPPERIAGAALQYRLPSISLLSQFADAGGLMSYGASLSEIRRRSGSYVDRILRGAHPGELPIEQPTTFELVINLATARTLALAIPPSLLLRADRVVE